MTRWRVQQRHELGGAGDDALRLKIDEGQVVAPGERAGDALRLRVPLVAQRLGERARAGAPAGGGEPIARDELGGEDELGDEIAERLEAAAPAPCAVGGRPGAIAEIGGRAEWARGLEVHARFPRSRYRHPAEHI